MPSAPTITDKTTPLRAAAFARSLDSGRDLFISVDRSNPTTQYARLELTDFTDIGLWDTQMNRIENPRTSISDNPDLIKSMFDILLCILINCVTEDEDLL